MSCFVSTPQVGLGSGAAFLSGFKTVIELGHPLGVGLTSCSMSVSIFLTIAMKNALFDVTHCVGPACWRDVVRLDAVVCGVAFLIAAATFTLRPRVASLSSLDTPRRVRRSSAVSFSGAFHSIDEQEASTATCARACENCSGGLFVFKDPFFWRLAVSDVAGLGCGTFLLASARQLWDNFDPASDQSATILTVRGVARMCVVICCAVLFCVLCCFVCCVFVYVCWGRVVRCVCAVAPWVSRPGFFASHVSAHTQVFSILAAIGNVGYPILADALSSRGLISRVRLMACTLAVFGCVFVTVALLNHAYGGGRATPAVRSTMFALFASVGFGFGAALVGFPVCVSTVFPVKYFGYVGGFPPQSTCLVR